MKLTRAAALIGLTSLLALTASACSSSTDAQAPASSAAAASAAASSGASREAGNRGTEVCVINNTSLNVSVSFSKKDTAQEGSIPAGGKKCGEGTFGVGNDVVGTLSYDDASWQTNFSATNPWMGYPSAYVGEKGPDDKLKCKSYDFDVRESISGDNGIVNLTLTRQADSDWKEFELVLSPSTNPSADGKRTAMKGFRSCMASHAAAAAA